MRNQKLKKIGFICIGFISLILGFLGIFLPLLPTTPFLLLAAYCFYRSSDKLYHWITHHKIFGKYILSYRKYRAIPLKTKLFTLFSLWITMGITILFFVNIIWLKCLLVIIAISVTIHVLRIRTLTADMLEASEDKHILREAKEKEGDSSTVSLKKAKKLLKIE